MAQKDLEKVFKKYVDKISADADKRVQRLSIEAEERTQLYFQAAEARFSDKLESVRSDLASKIDDVNDKVETILTTEIPEIKRKIDLTFEKVGEIAVDVEVIKETVKDHEVRIQRLEAR